MIYINLAFCTLKRKCNALKNCSPEKRIVILSRKASHLTVGNVHISFSKIALVAALLFSPALYSQEDILLQKSLEELMNVKVVTALMTEQKASDVVSTIHIVTEEQIRIRGYMDLQDVLEDVPEIQVDRKTNDISYNFISMRGIGGNEKFIILMDGLRVNSMAGEPHYVGSNYSVFNAKRIEIVIGPISALYGVDAYAGVINIITKNGDDIKGIHSRLSYGSFMTRDASLVAGWGDENFSYSFSGKYSHTEEPFFPDSYPTENKWYTQHYAPHGQMLDFSGNAINLAHIEKYKTPTSGLDGQFKLQIKNFELGFSRNQASHSTSLSYKPEYALRSETATNEFATQVFYAKHQFDSQDGKRELKTTLSYGTYEEFPQSAFVNVLTAYQPGYAFASDKTVKMEEQFSYNLSDAMFLLAGASFEDISSLPKIADLPAQFKNNIPADMQNLYYIGSNIADKNGKDLTIYRDIFNLNYQNYGAYLQLHVNPSKNLKITAGERLDRNTRYGTTLNPRLGLVFRPKNYLNLRLQYSEASLEPSPFTTYQYSGSFYPLKDEHGQVTGLEGGFWHLPNPDLKPERLSTYEAGVSFYLANHVILSTDGYLSFIRDLTSLGYTTDERFKNVLIKTVERAVNKGTSKTRGGTILLKSMFDPWPELALNVYAAYSYSDGDIEGKALPYNTKHTAKAGLDATHHQWSVSLRMNYYSHCYYTEVENGKNILKVNPGFTEANLMVRYSLMEATPYKVRLFLNAKNLLDSRYYHVEKPGTFATFGRVPQDPIRMIAGVDIEF
jgi:outer membrane receptor for ferrienterochelin and colicin